MKNNISIFCRLFIVLLIFIVSFLSIISCSNTQLVFSKRYGNYSPKPFEKIAVIGIFRRLENRRDYEDAIIRLLKKNGTDAIGGLSLLPPDEKYKYKEMESVFIAQKIDGILIIRVKSKSEKEKYHPPKEKIIPDESYPGYFNDYMGFYRVTTEPGYIEETAIFDIACNLYAKTDDRLVLLTEAKTTESGVKSDEPVNSKEDSAELAKLLVAELKKNRFIR